MDGRGAKVVRALLAGIVCFFFFLDLFVFQGWWERGGRFWVWVWVLVWFRFRGWGEGGGGCVCIPLSLPTYCCSLLPLPLSLTLLLLLSLSLRLSPCLPVSTSLSFPPWCSLFHFVWNGWLRDRGEREGREGKGIWGMGLPPDWTGTGNTYYANASVLMASGKS